MIIKNVPFFSNTSDNTHCYQAAIASVLKYFQPEVNYSFKELEKMSAKKEGLWTWPTQMILNLLNKGFEIIDVDDFDIAKFVKDGEDYLKEKYGKEVADKQIKYSDIKQEQTLYAQYFKLKKHSQRVPTLKEMSSIINNGSLIICNINARMLSNKGGYSAHSVVLFGIDDKFVYLHDPGLPPLPNRKVTIEDFNKAWAYPNKEAKNLTAFKLD